MTPPAQVAAAQPREERHPPSDQAAFGFRINFRFDSAVIPADAYEYLDTVGTVLHSEPEISIVVEGHTDAKGSDAYNMKLSERRAKAVEDLSGPEAPDPGFPHPRRRQRRGGASDRQSVRPDQPQGPVRPRQLRASGVSS